MAGMNPTGAALPMPMQAGEQAPQPTDPRDRATVGDDEGGANASPDEQAAYDNFVNAGYRLIYAGGKVNESILKLLDDDPKDLISVLGADAIGDHPTPVVALAAAASIICLQIVASAAEKPGGDIILHGGTEILEDLAQLADTAGIHTFSQEELNAAMLFATNLFRVTATEHGLVDEEALSQEFADILNAQDRGEVSKVLPGIERYDQGSQADGRTG